MAGRVADDDLQCCYGQRFECSDARSEYLSSISAVLVAGPFVIGPYALKDALEVIMEIWMLVSVS